MTAKVSYSTPMLHVAEIEKSIPFYELLGFVTVDTEGANPIGWARLHCEGGAVMFLRAEGPVNSTHPVMLCMYTPDLTGLREHLLASGVKLPPINYPGYMPSGEITLADPDGNIIIVCHWGKSEQEAWEKRIGAKP
jgi:hypothetical protein